ncbi:hypothetical protein DRE_00270 [Drechslerella stenobrocha 248]|uniref:PhoD-like phosphatase metallophosphatase domain-containing protein n=1 Tax=Drechslerella stenobrocha 248 TaxID=1043628 RepID=W7II48_9PEZI|nr:hypothetical protein DRE_00270 [Drechslerella stenobrocha 248]
MMFGFKVGPAVAAALLATTDLAAAIAAPHAAAFAWNAAFDSPSINHPFLAVPRHGPVDKRTAYSGPLFFSHGVASGDPYPDSVIIWTRAVPVDVNETAHIYTDKTPVCVEWEVWQDYECEDRERKVFSSGRTETSGDVDYTVKVEATGLEPFQTFYYKFKACDGSGESATGRTKTIPEADAWVNRVSFAVYSCANFAEGFYNAYGTPAKKDKMDYVLFLGDYSYEYKEPSFLPDRTPMPFKETIQLVDYRIRIAMQRRDPDLALNHANFPWISVWDDHEVANNGWKDGSPPNMNMMKEGVTWDQRKHNGLRAHFEWMPIRQVDSDDYFRIWRNFKIGKLVDLNMLDTRYYARDEGDDIEGAASPKRTMLGATQEKWLYERFDESQSRGAIWNVMGNQVQFSNMNETAVSGSALYYDGWMDYQVQRNRVMQNIVDRKMLNTVVLTGDYHALWAAELTHPEFMKYNHTSGDGAFGVELATTAVSSYSGYGLLKNLTACQEIAGHVVADNNQVKWAEGYYRGYIIVEFTPQEMKAEFYSLEVNVRTEEEFLAATWISEAGTNKFQRPFGPVKAGVLQSKLNPWAERS